MTERQLRVGNGSSMSLQYLKEAVANNDHEKLIRYVPLHLGDGANLNT